MATVEDQAEQDAQNQTANTQYRTQPANLSQQQGRPHVTVPPVERRRSTSSPDRAKTADEWRQRQGLTGMDAYWEMQRRAQRDRITATMTAGGQQTSTAPAAPSTQPAIQATATGSVGASSAPQSDPAAASSPGEQAALNALRPYGRPLGAGVAMRGSDGSVKFDSGATITPTGPISTTGTGDRALSSGYGTGSVTHGPRTEESMIGGMPSSQFFQKTANEQGQSNAFANAMRPMGPPGTRPQPKTAGPLFVNGQMQPRGAPPSLTAAAPTVSAAPPPPSTALPTPQAATTATTLPRPPTVAAPAPPAAPAQSPGVAPWQPDVAGWKQETQAKLDASRAQTTAAIPAALKPLGKPLLSGGYTPRSNPLEPQGIAGARRASKSGATFI